MYRHRHHNHSLTSAILVSLLFSLPLAAQDELAVMRLAGAAASPPAAIESMTWMAGHWHGEGLGGQVEELWSGPAGGAMMGSFRYLKDGKLGFYELMTLVEESGSLTFRLKHFNADLSGWEEKLETIDFPLVRMEADTAYFDGISYRRVADNGMIVAVRVGDGDDETVARFHYRRPE